LKGYDEIAKTRDYRLLQRCQLTTIPVSAYSITGRLFSGPVSADNAAATEQDRR